MIKNITKVKWAPIRQLPIYYLPMGEWWRKPANAQSRTRHFLILGEWACVTSYSFHDSFAPIKGNRIHECGEIMLVESRIRENIACGIWNLELWNLEYSSRNPESPQRLESGIQVPLYWQRLESNTWNPESTAWSPESKTVLDCIK